MAEIGKASEKPKEEEKAKEAGPKMVNFKDQDYEALVEVFQKQKKVLYDTIPEKYISGINHVGSTAIRGMPGPQSVDMVMFLHDWPIDEAVLKALEDLKYKSLGDAPHFQGDKWFGLITVEGATMQDLGSSVLHVVHKDNKAPIERQIIFAEYCNNNKEAFDKYKAVKLIALEEGSGEFSKYKKKKSELLEEMFPMALEWKKQQEKEAAANKSE